nr:MAG TPA: tail tubular protein [Caudoviricetes sp.]
MNNVDICNLALSYLGAATIGSFDEANENARQCKLHYDAQRQALLRDYNWGFARRITDLAPLDTTVPGWAYAYRYPSKCIAVRRVFDPEDIDLKRATSEYSMCILDEANKVLLSDVANAKCEYTYDITNANLFPGAFADALARAMAAAMAIAITGSESKQQAQYQLLQVQLNKSHVAVAKEQSYEQVYPDRYIRARG